MSSKSQPNPPMLPWITTTKAFTEWVNHQAKVGDRVCYHIGNVSDGQHMKDVAALHAMAGRLFLYQVRIQEGEYHYCAQRLSEAAGKVLRMGEMQS